MRARASPSVYSAYGNEVMFAGYMYDAETAVVSAAV